MRRRAGAAPASPPTAARGLLRERLPAGRFVAAASTAATTLRTTCAARPAAGAGPDEDRPALHAAALPSALRPTFRARAVARHTAGCRRARRWPPRDPLPA